MGGGRGAAQSGRGEHRDSFLSRAALTALLAAFAVCAPLPLSSCSTPHAHHKAKAAASKTKKRSAANVHYVKPVRIMHMDHERGSELLRAFALNLLGSPYKYGGTDAKTGIDCSAFVQQAYKSLGVNMPRTSREQAQAGMPVDLSQIRVGDLVFFGSGGAITHVGMYAGDDRFIHSPNSRSKVRTDNLSDPHYQKRFMGARNYFLF